MMWTIVMPLAGDGTRSRSWLPKPLVPVDGQPMVYRALRSLGDPMLAESRFIFVIQEAHARKFHLDSHLHKLSQGCDIITVDKTAGPACSVLAAAPLFGRGPLLVANGDGWLRWNPEAFRRATIGLEGLLAVHRSTDPRFSYVETVGDRVIRTVEKEPVSDLASSGVYWFAQSTEFVRAAVEMIAAGDDKNGEFYIAPIYNYLRGPVGWFEVDEFRDMGTREAVGAWQRCP